MSGTSTIRVLLIPEEGPTSVLHIEPRLPDFQRHVGGYIQVVPLEARLDAEGAGAYVDEEGLIKQRRPNPRASALAGQLIVGPMVVLGHPDSRGNDTGVPDRALDLIDTWLSVIPA